MPFADQCGAVAGSTQQRREGRVTRRYAHLWRVAIAPSQRLYEPDRQPILLVSFGDQRNARVGEADHFTGEPVEHRRRVIGLSSAAEIGITAIVDNNEKDVRRIRWRHGRLL